MVRPICWPCTGANTERRPVWGVGDQIAKNLTDAEEGFLCGKRYSNMDRDGKFCPAFPEILENEGIQPLDVPERCREPERRIRAVFNWTINPRGPVRGCFPPREGSFPNHTSSAGNWG